MLWLCEKSLSENLFDSVLRWWYPGVLVNTGESRGPGDQFNRDNPEKGSTPDLKTKSTGFGCNLHPNGCKFIITRFLSKFSYFEISSK